PPRRASDPSTRYKRPEAPPWSQPSRGAFRPAYKPPAATASTLTVFNRPSDASQDGVHATAKPMNTAHVTAAAKVKPTPCTTLRRRTRISPSPSVAYGKLCAPRVE